MLKEIINYLILQNNHTIIYMFCFFIFIELPRFFLSGIVAIFATFKLMRQKIKTINCKKTYAISVLLPVHNNSNLIKTTIISLHEQINVKLQIIVINDGSDDNIKLICQELLQNNLIHEFINLEARSGKAAALNIGLKFVKYPIVLSTDVDVSFDKDALFQGCCYFNDIHVGAVCGNLKVRNVNTSLATNLQGLNYMFGITLGRMVKDFLGFYFVISGAFGLFRTQILIDLNGWNYGPGDDGDMSVQILLSKWKVRFAVLANAFTQTPVTFSALAEQRLRWNRSTIRVRYRKFRNIIFNIYRRSFNLTLAISFLETYFFQGILPIVFLFYIGQLIFSYGKFSILIILIIHFVYFIMQLIKFLLIISFSNYKRQDLKLLKYLPAYSFFNNYFLRIIALYAVINELIFRGSYKDNFSPKKVRNKVDKF